MWAVIAVLCLTWALLFFGFPAVMGAMVHALLVVAIILILVGFVQHRG